MGGLPHESNPGSFMELGEPVILVLMENIKHGKCKMESTDTVHWGGSLRSSDEVAVMACGFMDKFCNLPTIPQALQPQII